VRRGERDELRVADLAPPFVFEFTRHSVSPRGLVSPLLRRSALL
jgi:hypothetical protein